MTAAYGKPDEILTHRPRFGRFLRQAQDAKLIDVTKTPSGYEGSLRPDVAAALPASAPAAEEAPKKGRGRSRGRPAAEPKEPAETPEAESEAEVAPKGSPRGLLNRRGSKHGAKSAQIPLVGVVDLEEGEAAPAKKPRARRAPRGGSRRGGRKKGGAAGE
jgi:hypothetical protein